MFYDYYFDTTTNTISDKDQVESVNHDDDDDEKTEDVPDKQDKPLFYPSYSFAKDIVPRALLMANSKNISKKTNDMIDDDEFDFHIADDEENVFYMTVGLNSNMTVRDFARKKLNLVIVLDISGSMGGSFSGGGDSKMKIANNCILSLLTHLNPDDRFGLVLFDHTTKVLINFKLMKDHKMNDIKQICNISPQGGTNMEIGYKEGLKMFGSLSEEEQDAQLYENRMIFLTDAHPNAGKTNPDSLLSMVDRVANDEILSKRIYTTFVGIGLDFNANLVNEITKTRGANYFAVKSEKDFFKRLDLEFDYFVSPMVFDLKLIIQSEGGGTCIDCVYGSNNINISSGEVMNISTLFPSPPNESGDIKGGIVLIKLLKNHKTNKYENVNIECSFENKFGQRFSTTQHVTVQSVKQKQIFPNNGVRKAILLTNYVVLIKKWISDNKESYGSFSVTPQWKQIFNKFTEYFQNEMKMVKDDTLSQEIEILQLLS